MTQRFGYPSEERLSRIVAEIDKLSRPEVRVPPRAHDQMPWSPPHKPRQSITSRQFWSLYWLCIVSALACIARTFVTGDMRWWWGAVGFVVVAFVGVAVQFHYEINRES